MALITCPECGGQVSDQADVCIHCGYPLSKIKEEQTYKIILYSNGNKKLLFRDLAIVAEHTLNIRYNDKESQELYAISVKKIPQTVLADGMTYDNAKYVQEEWTRRRYNVSVQESDAPFNDETNRFISENRQGVVRCPRCGCTDIGVANRGFSIITGPIGSGKSMNVCKKCGYKWTP